MTHQYRNLAIIFPQLSAGCSVKFKNPLLVTKKGGKIFFYQLVYWKQKTQELSYDSEKICIFGQTSQVLSNVHELIIMEFWLCIHR